VLLSGSGGDELLEGEMALFSHELRRGRLSAVRELWNLRGPDLPRPMSRLRQWVAYPLVKPLIPGRVLAWRRRRALRNAQRWLRVSSAATLEEAFGGARLPVDRSPSERFASFARAPALVAHARLRAQIATSADCEWRDPLLFPSLVRFVARVPARAFFHGGYARGLYRKALEGRVPDEVRLRTTKASFEPAFFELLKGGGAFGALRSLADVPRLAALGLVDPARVRSEFDFMERAPDESNWSVWSALACEEFLRRHT
jgi:hypothetical protein